MSTYNIIAETNEATVVSEYIPPERRKRSYLSEAELERNFIGDLQEQGYEYLAINTEDDLVANLRTQLEKLNHMTFSETEWGRFYGQNLANDNEGIAEKTFTIQSDHIKVLARDDGSVKNIYLIDKHSIHNNSLQVIHQFTPEGGRYANRYDVTILVNGLPLVHCELKRRGVNIREAFNQIRRYNHDSFWAGEGLFQFERNEHKIFSQHDPRGKHKGADEQEGEREEDKQLL